VKQYSNVLFHHYGSYSTVVYDGYHMGASIKDPEQLKRPQKNKAAPDIALSADKPAYKNPAQFLANKRNKSSFAKLLASHLQTMDFTILHACRHSDSKNSLASCL
jgi:hypothetical protein